MDVIIYTAIVITGVVFGSFFTLAVYRIPRKENILYGRSHCTSCNHKLSFFDLIPVLSYLFLKGKCRYCGEKIRIRYFLLEVFSGLVFFLVAYTHGIENLIELILIYMFMSAMFIIAGIDKEKNIISNGVCIYAFIISLLKIGYFAFLKKSIFDFLIGMTAFPLLLLIIDFLVYVSKRNYEDIPIGLGDIKYLAIIGLMFGYKIQILSIFVSSIIMLFGVLIHKYKRIPWGYYLTISTILIVIIEPYIINYLELI